MSNGARSVQTLAPNKSGMALKGRTPTAKEKAHMERVVAMGCIVCYGRGFPRVPAEIHHIDGKTKKDCHFKVLPLCFEHHRQGNSKEPISRHPYKKRFENKYGTEDQLLDKVREFIRLDKYYDGEDYDDLPF